MEGETAPDRPRTETAMVSNLTDPASVKSLLILSCFHMVTRNSIRYSPEPYKDTNNG